VKYMNYKKHLKYINLVLNYAHSSMVTVAVKLHVLIYRKTVGNGRLKKFVRS